MFAIIATALALTAAAPVSGDLAAVQAHLVGTRALSAQFSQTDRAGQVLSGTLTLKQPGKLRFQYAQGVPILIVADGKALNFVDYSVKQVSRWPIASSPLAVLLDPARNIDKYAKLVPSGDPRVVSVLAYDRKRPEYGRINLIFTRDGAAPAGLSLSGWVALDAQGNRTTVRLSGQRYNGSVSDEAFRWNDPRKKAAQKPVGR
ncbi:MAG: outer membrane lipoprotein carrier protein LolA [Pseudomonadota bacterium]